MRRLLPLLLLMMNLYGVENRYAKFEGIDYLQVLSNQWVIAVVRNADEIEANLNDLTSGQYDQLKRAWDEEGTNVGAFNALRSFHRKFFAVSRLSAQEKELDFYDFYTITSEDDKDYPKEGEHPLRVTRQILSLGQSEAPALGPIDFAHYCYLELPRPMKSGKTYTLSLKSGRRVTFLYDEKSTLSRAIKVNQGGYDRLSKHKFAYLGGYLQEFGSLEGFEGLPFYIHEAKGGKQVFEGKVQRRTLSENALSAEKEQTGEVVYEMDFGPLTREGKFYLSIPGIGRSWTFKNTFDPYGPIFYKCAKALSANRSGAIYENAWGRKGFEDHTVVASDHIPFFATAARPKDYRGSDVIGFTAKIIRQMRDLKGGWDDLRGERHLSQFTVIFDMLTAFEEHPEKFTDGQLALSESGNGIPDILDEAEWGLKVWEKTLDTDGGVVGAIVPVSLPHKKGKTSLALSKKTRWASLLFSTACAQYAQLVRPFSSDKADHYLSLARRSFEYGADPKNSLGEISISAATKGGAGVPYMIKWQEKERMLAPYLLYAKVRLFAATKEKGYLEKLDTLARQSPKPYLWPFSLKDFSPWINYSTLKYGEKALTEDTKNRLRLEMIEEGDRLLEMAREQAYRESWPLESVSYGGWGDACMANPARALIAAYLVTQNAIYLRGAETNMSFLFGTNPMGMAWTTGVGKVYPVGIEPPYQFEQKTFDPLPGLTVYGPSGDMFFALKNEVWSVIGQGGKKETFVNSVNRKIPFWRTWSAHPRLNTAQCGYSPSETLSPVLFCTAFLMKEGWHPSPVLKMKKPKSSQALYGRYFTP